jgi:voltage-gated potassium channel
MGRRVGLALALVFFVALVVRLGNGGYEDSATGDSITMVDALYYASVTVTTTGYGDITAIDQGSRLATILLITPARIMFLILVVSTTVEVLTIQTRDRFRARRWRNKVNNHIVICGYGATGQSAAADLIRRGTDPNDIVVVDVHDEAMDAAAADGIVAVRGDATLNAVLDQAGVADARAVIITPNRDDTAVLITLTVRELTETAHIVAGGREQENLHLLRQGGADEVIDATAAVGRMLGLGTSAPGAVRVLDDILDAGTGLELVEVVPDTEGAAPCVPEGANLVAIIRNGRRLPPSQTDTAVIQAADRLVVVREGSGA